MLVAGWRTRDMAELAPQGLAAAAAAAAAATAAAAAAAAAAHWVFQTIGILAAHAALHARARAWTCNHHEPRFCCSTCTSHTRTSSAQTCAAFLLCAQLLLRTRAWRCNAACQKRNDAMASRAAERALQTCIAVVDKRRMHDAIVPALHRSYKIAHRRKCVEVQRCSIKGLPSGTRSLVCLVSDCVVL